MPRNPSRRRHRSAPRRAYSLIEVAAATALMGSTLVPAMELIRDGIDLSLETDRRQLIALYAVSQVEQKLSAVSLSWATGSTSGDFSADGNADVRFSTTCSDSPLDGGVTGLLMAIQSTVYYDEDGDDTLDSDELSCSFHTKIGKFATYDALAP